MVKIVQKVEDDPNKILFTREMVMRGTWTCDQCDTVVQVEQGDTYSVGRHDTSIRLQCPVCSGPRFFSRTRKSFESQKKKSWIRGW